MDVACFFFLERHPIPIKGPLHRAAILTDFVLVQDLRLLKPVPQWPPNLMLPMMLLRENLQQSVFQNINPAQGQPFFDMTSGTFAKPPKGTHTNLGTDQDHTRTVLGKIPVDNNGSHVCADCGRIYKLRSSLRNHQKWECGKEPQFKCPFCSYKAKQKMHMLRHTERMHKGMDLSCIKREMGAEEEAPHVEEVKDLSLKGQQNETSK